MIETHTHNGTDSPQVNYTDLIFPIATALSADPTTSAGAVYDAIAQNLINQLKSEVIELKAIIKAQKLAK